MREPQPNQTFSTATLNPFHLLEASLPYVDGNPMLAPIADDIRECLRTEGDAFELWYEVVVPYLEGIAPEGCVFGALEGDASHLGWWEADVGA